MSQGDLWDRPVGPVECGALIHATPGRGRSALGQHCLQNDDVKHVLAGLKPQIAVEGEGMIPHRIQSDRPDQPTIRRECLDYGIVAPDHPGPVRLDVGIQRLVIRIDVVAPAGSIGIRCTDDRPKQAAPIRMKPVDLCVLSSGIGKPVACHDQRVRHGAAWKRMSSEYVAVVLDRPDTGLVCRGKQQ